MRVKKTPPRTAWIGLKIVIPILTTTRDGVCVPAATTLNYIFFYPFFEVLYNKRLKTVTWTCLKRSTKTTTYRKYFTTVHHFSTPVLCFLLFYSLLFLHFLFFCFSSSSSSVFIFSFFFFFFFIFYFFIFLLLHFLLLLLLHFLHLLFHQVFNSSFSSIF